MQRFIATLAMLLALVPTIESCQTATGSEPATAGPNDKAFNNYWYGGTAELSSFTLRQARYGEIHEGEAVLIFVTEPFSESKQVKLDNPAATPRDKVDGGVNISARTASNRPLP